MKSAAMGRAAVLLSGVALVLALGGAPAYASTIAVNTTDDELNADGDCSLREAIQAANTDAAVDACTPGSGADTLQLPAGTHTLSIPGAEEDSNQTGDLDIASDLTLAGIGAASTIIDGNHLDRVVHVVGGTVTISRITLQHGGLLTGIGTCNGAGIFNGGSGGLVTVNDTVVTDNTAGDGSGITNYATMTLNDTAVTGNTAVKRGGGMSNAGSGALILNRSTVSGNHQSGFSSSLSPPCVGLSGFGAGGVFNSDGGNLTLNDSTVNGNDAQFRGGGIYDYSTGTILSVNRSTISGNVAGDTGGGIANATGAVAMLTNSTLSGNSASTTGGAIHASESTVTLSNSTISDNSSQNGTDGLTAEFGGVVNLGSSILANGAHGRDCSGSTITSQGYDLIENAADCTIAGDTTGNVTGMDPALGPLADNGGRTLTHALLDGSPAVNAGPPTSGSPSCPPPTVDQRGVSRPQGGRCDIGAFERVAYAFTGFFPPVGNPPALNSAKAGSGIPVKFSLSGNQGLNIFAAGYPKSQPIDCVTKDPTAAATPTSGTLSYYAAADRYTYNWKTDKGWAMTCRKLIVRLSDFSDHIAYFKFTK